MPVAPFVPLIAQGVGMVAGGIAGKKAEKNAMKRSPEEQAALAGASNVAGQAAGAGNQLLSQARPYTSQAGSYYQTLLNGNRAAMTQAVAPGIASATDVYRGAERSLDKSGVRGAARDVAAGDLARARASKIAGLTTGVQPAAANALAGLGTNLTGQAQGMYNTGGTIYANLLGQGAQNRQYARGEGGKTGAAIGGLVRDLGEAWPKGSGGGVKNSTVGPYSGTYNFPQTDPMGTPPRFLSNDF